MKQKYSKKKSNKTDLKKKQQECIELPSSVYSSKVKGIHYCCMLIKKTRIGKSLEKVGDLGTHTQYVNCSKSGNANCQLPIYATLSLSLLLAW